MKNNGIIDISVPLSINIPIWPGSPGFSLKFYQIIDNKKNLTNNSTLTCEVHTGTHIDAPLHHLKNGNSIDKIALNDLIGLVRVIYFQDQDVITKKDLESVDLPKNIDKILIKTKNSQLWDEPSGKFFPSYVGLSRDAAQWIIDRDIRLVGIDYLSIEPYNSDSGTHKLLLGSKIIIIEGLNLSKVNSGYYELICLPISLVGVEGAPTRAILREIIPKDGFAND
jgi:arylformamidase